MAWKKQARSLPNGKTTFDAIEYIDSWRKFGALIEDKLELCLLGYDPGIVFIDAETHKTYEFDTNIIRKLNIALGGKHAEFGI